MANKFCRKNYGAIYVIVESDIEKVENIIKEMDEWEYGYLPEGLIKPFSDYPSVTYTHKFDDLDIDALTAICWSKGIFIWCFDARTEYPENSIEKYNIE